MREIPVSGPDSTKQVGNALRVLIPHGGEEGWASWC